MPFSAGADWSLTKIRVTPVVKSVEATTPSIVMAPGAESVMSVVVATKQLALMSNP